MGRISIIRRVDRAKPFAVIHCDIVVYATHRNCQDIFDNADQIDDNLVRRTHAIGSSSLSRAVPQG